MMNSLDNLSPEEREQIIVYSKGLVEGIRSVLDEENADFELQDYWNAWDHTIDINIMHDPTTGKHVLCLYPVFNMIRDDSTYERMEI